MGLWSGSGIFSLLHATFGIFFILLLFGKVNTDGFSGIPGSFCANRTDGERCCVSRNDRCAVPLFGTECYCDDFCDRREGGDIPDCCPDFYHHCRGIYRPAPETTTTSTTETWTLPPARQPEVPKVVQGCWMDGAFHPVETQIKRNCNQCTCQQLVDESAEHRQELFEFLCDSHVCLIQDDLIQRVNTNSESYRWTAAAYPFFYGLTLAEGYRYRLGTFKPEGSVARMHEIRIDRNAVLPDRFDARNRWPGLVHPVRDQGNCAASWAFSTAETASDRLAILTRGEVLGGLSPQHLLSCNMKQQKGCQGGYVDRAWWFVFKGSGIVTENCYPYRGEASKCEIFIYNQTTVTRCPSGVDERHLWTVTPTYRIANNELEIKYEISTNGPVQAVFRVAPDFFSYKSGVYQSVETQSPSDPTSNYHSVRILGWGVDHSAVPPVPYWLCTNSWGREWGEDGTFRIVRGKNEAEIESFVVGVWGKRHSNEVAHSVDPDTVHDNYSILAKTKRNFNKKSIARRVDSMVDLVDRLLQ